MGTQSDRHSPVSLSSCSERLLSIGSLSVRPLSPPDDPSSGTTSHTRKIPKKIPQGHCEKSQNQGENYPTTIGTLPDNVLLGIFDFYRNDHDYRLDYRSPVWKWHLLVHVCQIWRQIVFASPHYLDLKILCTYGTPTRKNLGIWPAFPIIIRYSDTWTSITRNDEDNIIFALEHRDRVCDVGLAAVHWGSQLKKFVTAMQKPFPVLTHLCILSGFGDHDGDPPVFPAEFLGGSAPCLQEISLSDIPYPALPHLLSASDLIRLYLCQIPPTGYFPPEAMVASLATLPRLDSFTIGFRSATPRPYRIFPPLIDLMTRAVLPVLTSFRFRGASEYLEDLVAQIDSPELNHISIEYLRLVDYEVTQLSKFIDRSVGPKLTLSVYARVYFSGVNVSFSLYPHVNRPPLDCCLPEASISCDGINWSALDITRLLSHFRTLLSNVVRLDLGGDSHQLGDMGDVDWLHLLRQFPTVQMLRLYCEPAERVTLALEDISGDLVAEVLPSLDLVCMVDQPASSIEKFVAARVLSGCPVTVVHTETEFYRKLDSYVNK